MLRTYLDQNKWVDLAHAATGHTSERRSGTPSTSAGQVSKPGPCRSRSTYIGTGKPVNAETSAPATMSLTSCGNSPRSTQWRRRSAFSIVKSTWRSNDSSAPRTVHVRSRCWPRPGVRWSAVLAADAGRLDAEVQHDDAGDEQPQGRCGVADEQPGRCEEGERPPADRLRMTVGPSSGAGGAESADETHDPEQADRRRSQGPWSVLSGRVRPLQRVPNEAKRKKAFRPLCRRCPGH